MKSYIFLAFTAVLGMNIPGLVVPSAYRNLIESSGNSTTPSTSSSIPVTSAINSISTPGARIPNEKGGNENKNTDPKPPIDSSKSSTSTSSTSSSNPISGTATLPHPVPDPERSTLPSPKEGRTSSPSSATNLKCHSLSNTRGRIAGISQESQTSQSNTRNAIIECEDEQGRIVRTTSRDGRLVPISGSGTAAGIVNGIPTQRNNGLGNVPTIDVNGQDPIQRGNGQQTIQGQIIDGKPDNPRGTIRQGNRNVIHTQVIQSNGGGITIEAVGTSDIRLGNVRVLVN